MQRNCEIKFRTYCEYDISWYARQTLIKDVAVYSALFEIKNHLIRIILFLLLFRKEDIHTS